MFLNKQVNRFLIAAILSAGLSSFLAENNRAGQYEIIERNRDLNCEIDLCTVEKSSPRDCSVASCDRSEIDFEPNEDNEAILIIRNDTEEPVFYDIDFRSRVPVRKFTDERLSSRHLLTYTTNKRMGAIVDFDFDLCQAGIQAETKLVYASDNNKHNYHAFEKIDACKISLRLAR